MPNKAYLMLIAVHEVVVHAVVEEDKAESYREAT
jgi:hypothetical protein